MTIRSLPLLLALLSGCLTPVGENPVGSIDGGTSSQGGGGNTGGGGSTGGGGAMGGGATGGGGGGGFVTPTDGGVTCTANNFCWEGTTFGGTFHAMHGIGNTLVVAVGEGGVIATWNGTQWNYTQSPTTKTLRSVWLESATHGWAVGDESTILEFNGTTWTPLLLNLANKDLSAVHGLAGGPVFIGGVETLLRMDGTNITTLNSVLPVTDSQAIVRGIRVLSGDDVYVIGSGGVNFFLHYTGTANGWVDMYATSPNVAPTSSDMLSGIDTCGSSLFLSGSFSGEGNASWMRINSSWDISYVQGAHIACVSPDSFFSYGTAFFGIDDLIKVDLSTGSGQRTIGTGVGIEAAYVAGAQEAFFAGKNGTLLHWTGTDLTSNKPQRTTRVFAFAGDNVWRVRGDDTVERFDGTSWSAMSIPEGGWLLDIYAPSRDEAWVVRQGHVWHLLANNWTEVSGFPTGTSYVTGSGANDVWFSGGDGVVMQWNGTALSSRFLPSQDSTGPMHVTTTQWWVPTYDPQSGVRSTFQFDTTWRDRGVLGWRVGGAGNDVYFTSALGLSRFDGTQPVAVTNETDSAVLTSSNAAVYVVKTRYVIGNFNKSTLVRVPMGGTQFETVDLPTAQISDVQASPDGHVWVLSNGGLLHQRP